MYFLLQRYDRARPSEIHYAPGELPRLGEQVTLRGHVFRVVDVEHRIGRSRVGTVIVYVEQVS